MERNSVSVALVSPAWPAGTIANGIASYVGNLVDGLRQCDCRPQVLAWQVENEGPDNGIHTIVPWERTAGCLTQAGIRLGFRLVPDWCRRRTASQAILNAIARVQRTEGLDLIEMEESFGCVGAVAGKSPFPVVTRLHGPWFLNGRADGVRENAQFRGRVRREGWALEQVAGISAPSADVLAQAREYYRTEIRDAEVIPNPVVPAPASCRWRLEECEHHTFLFVGRFDRHKGGDVIIEAFARVARHHSGAKLLFVGPDRGCIDEHGRRWSLAEYVSERVAGADLRSRFAYLGHRSPSEIAVSRKQCLATIVCSRYEVFGYTAAEAMATGCPLIASAVGGLSEMVQDDRNGLLCRPGNPEDLAAKMLTYLRNPESAARLGRQAAIDVQERYQPRVIAERTLAFYQRVIERFKASRPVRRRWWGYR